MLHEGDFMVSGCSTCRNKPGCTPSCWKQRAAKLKQYKAEKNASEADLSGLVSTQGGQATVEKDINNKKLNSQATVTTGVDWQRLS